MVRPRSISRCPDPRRPRKDANGFAADTLSRRTLGTSANVTPALRGRTKAYQVQLCTIAAQGEGRVESLGTILERLNSLEKGVLHATWLGRVVRLHSRMRAKLRRRIAESLPKYAAQMLLVGKPVFYAQQDKRPTV